ncbi:Conserved_hypothetical protein [Hexamita inflata]|uniref:Uncharacterized protein n=1 Tax=Hexamita inflata TaxID=28002 RepID=A0AA86P7R1_9EUKA|nr:Conserved hypothetical protein [Hexamita inflata]
MRKLENQGQRTKQGGGKRAMQENSEGISEQSELRSTNQELQAAKLPCSEQLPQARSSRFSTFPCFSVIFFRKSLPESQNPNFPTRNQPRHHRNEHQSQIPVEKTVKSEKRETENNQGREHHQAAHTEHTRPAHPSQHPQPSQQAPHSAPGSTQPSTTPSIYQGSQLRLPGGILDTRQRAKNKINEESSASKNLQPNIQYEYFYRVAPQLLEFTYSSQCTRAPWSMESGGFASISQAGETIHTCRGDSHLEAVSHNMPKGGFSQLLCQTRLQTSALIKMFLSYQSRLLAVRGPQQDKTNLSRDGLNPAHVPLHG